MNWGHKITIGFITFVLFMIGMVTISMNTDYSLVEENYYEEELAYQGAIDSQNNGKKWTKRIHIAQVDDFIEMTFEDADAIKAGKVNFFRPSDAKLDFSFPIVEKLSLPKNEIVPGKWIINLQWEYEGRQYSKEEIIFIGS